jgi:hypothetical protein
LPLSVATVWFLRRSSAKGDGKLEDPFGHQWSIGTHVRDVSQEAMQKAMEQMGS